MRLPVYLSVLLIFSFFSSTQLVSSSTFTITPSEKTKPISDAISKAKHGDTIVVGKGIYKEQIVIDKTISLIGVNYPVIQGEGKGTIIKVKAPGVVLKGFKIINTGSSLTAEHSGIEAESAPKLLVEENYLSEVLFGIYLKDSPETIIRNNYIEGKKLPLPDRGDGVRLWYSPKTKVLNNKLLSTRDLVIWWSNNTLIKNNEVKNGRYGLHYMYSNHNVFEDNKFIGNSVGGFLMYSNNIKFYRNIFALNQGLASGYGVGFKDLDDLIAEDNIFVDNRIGLYLDNSPHLINSWNNITKNVMAYNDIGLSIMPSVERNVFLSNSFFENTEQVEVRGGGTLKGNFWYKDKRGNYWSDYVGYDENGDGVGEIPYLAESLFESLTDKYPNLRVLIFSPASQALELASEAFPLFKPEPKVVDKYPLTRAIISDTFASGPKEISIKFFFISALLVFIPLLLVLWLYKNGVIIDKNR